MVIEELHVKNFGKLQDTKVPLQEGLNLIYGPNESGKTTLRAFLKCMLFGMRRARASAAANDVYSRYEPWEYSDYYAGSMRFSSGPKTFCLERNFQKDSVTTELFDITDGEKIPMRRGELAALLGNISEAVYDNTVSVGQTWADQELAQELKNYMANYQGAGDSDLDLNKTMQILNDQRKLFEKDLQIKKAQEESEKNETAARLLSLRQENQELQRKIQLEKNQMLQLEKQQKELGDTASPKALKKQKFRRRILDISLILLVIFIAAAAAAAAFFLPKWTPIAVILAGVLLEGGGLFFRRKMQKKISAAQEKLQEDQEMLARQIKRVKSRLHTQEQTFREKTADQEALAEALHTYNQEIYRKDPAEEEIEGIKMAMEAIKAVGQRLQKDLGGRICARTSEILAELTKGNYHQVAVSRDLQVKISAQNRQIPVEQLSRGTMEQVYFALRMAVGDILCSRVPLPVILDDVFAMYDEERLTETLRWLAAHKQQVLLFTCQKREQQILDACEIPYHRVGVFDS